MRRRKVHESVACDALLVGQRAPVADQRDDEPVPDALEIALVAAEPGDRPDRGGREYDAIREFSRARLQRLGEQRQQRHARQVVVAERRMTNVAVQQDLVFDVTGKTALGVCEAAVGERAVDAHFVLARLELLEVPMGETESPSLLVVRRPERNPIRVVRQRVQMRLQVGQRHLRPDRRGIPDHVERVALQVDDPIAARALHPGLADVPLLRNGPVEDGRAARHLEDFEWDVLLHDPEAPANTVAGDAAHDRIEPAHQRVDLFADGGIVGHTRVARRRHGLGISALRHGDGASIDTTPPFARARCAARS